MSKRSQLLATVATSALLLFASSTAHAQDEPTPQELEQAGVHFQRGAEHYTAGQYSKAIVEFLKAYNVVPNALFLYNISLSYGKLGNVEDALAAALKARDGQGLDENTATRNVARIDAYQRWDTATSTAEDIAEAAALAAQKPDEPAEPKSSFGGLGWAGVGLFTVGIGLDIGAGIIANNMAPVIEEYEAAAAAGDSETYDRLRSDLRQDQNLGIALFAAGTGAAALGLIFIITDLTNDGGGDRDVSASIVPVSGGGAAAHVQVKF